MKVEGTRRVQMKISGATFALKAKADPFDRYCQIKHVGCQIQNRLANFKKKRTKRQTNKKKKQTCTTPNPTVMGILLLLYNIQCSINRIYYSFHIVPFHTGRVTVQRRSRRDKQGFIPGAHILMATHYFRKASVSHELGCFP